MKISIKYLIFFIYIIGVIYLILPSPDTPGLDNSFRSTEEGDTWQNPNQKGYYTDLTRHQVISQIQQKFSLNIFGSGFLGFRLNYPPEEAQTIVRDQLKSNYLEEVIHPLRESLFINGWEPENDPKMAQIPPSKRSSLIANGKIYQAKITLYPVFPNVFARLFIWTLIFPCSFLVMISMKKALNA